MPSACAMHLLVLPETYSICRLTSGAVVPPCPAGTKLWAAIQTPDETSVVCPATLAPRDAMQSHGWRCFRVAGTLQLDQVGILAGLTHVLAAANVSVFALSTYDTDYVLVREEQLAQAVASLRGAGYEMSVSAGGEGPRATTKQDDP